MSIHRQASMADEWVERRRRRPPVPRWSAAGLARRRARAVAADQAEASELRGDDVAIVEAWWHVVDAIDEAEREEPADPGDAMAEFARRSLPGDALPQALASPDAWTSDDDDDPDGDEDAR